jgi:hypothetical protein
MLSCRCWLLAFVHHLAGPPGFGPYAHGPPGSACRRAPWPFCASYALPLRLAAAAVDQLAILVWRVLLLLAFFPPLRGQPIAFHRRGWPRRRVAPDSSGICCGYTWRWTKGATAATTRKHACNAEASQPRGSKRDIDSIDPDSTAFFVGSPIAITCAIGSRSRT